MLNEKLIRDNIKKEILKGCRVKEYFYDHNNKEVSRSDSWYQEYEDFSIDFIGVVPDTDNYILEESIVISKGGIKFSESNITFSDNNYPIRAIPFTVVDIAEFNKEIPLIGDGKKQCNTLSFDIKTQITSAKKDKEIQRISTSKFNVAVDKDAWIYIIILKDGSLPIIVVSNTRVGFLGVDDDINDTDIKDYTFKYSKEGFFNSYYYPYNFEVREIKTYENTVYTEPGTDIMQQLNFSEELSEDGIYSNSENISVIKSSEINEVKFKDNIIGYYKNGENINIDNFEIYNIMKSSLENIKENGYQIGQPEMFDALDINNSKAGFILIPPTANGLAYKNEDYEIYYCKVEDQNWNLPNNINCMIGIKDSNITQILGFREDNDIISKVQFLCYDNNHTTDISIILNPDDFTCFEYHAAIKGITDSRCIRSLTNEKCILFNAPTIHQTTQLLYYNYFITDNDGNIIESSFNFGKDAEFIKLSYNAFGVPKNL